MAKGTTKQEYQAIKAFIKKNPDMKAAEAAKELKIGTTTLSHVKNSKNYEEFKTKYSRSNKVTPENFEKELKKARKNPKSLEELIEEFLDDEKPKSNKKKTVKKVSFWQKVKDLFKR